MRAELRLLPSDQVPVRFIEIGGRLSIEQILELVDAPEWFFEFGVVKLSGHIIPRENWRKIKIKPNCTEILDLTVVPQQGVLRAALAVTVVVGALAIGSFGLPFLGAGFLAGTFGANAAAAALGIGGSLLVNALTAPPAANNQNTGQVQKTSAGISQNTPVINDVLPVIFGKIGLSPPPLMPPYTTFANDDTTVTAIVGVEGRCQISNVLINGLATDQFPGLVIETREGGLYDEPRTIGLETVIEQRPSITLSSFNSKQTTYGADPIISQPPAATDLPQWHGLKTDGTADDFTVLFLAQNGIVDTGTPANLTTVPIRLRIRLKGSSTWRNIPELHLQDITKGSKPARWEAKFIFTDALPGGPLVGRNSYLPIWDATNIAGYGTAYQYNADSYFIGYSWKGLMAGAGPGWINNFNATGTTTSGMTVTASSTDTTNSPWKAFDGESNPSTFWKSDATGFPQWLQVQFSSAKTIRSYVLNTPPTAWYFQGSNDGTNWTTLDDNAVDLGAASTQNYAYCNVQHPGSYIYYRWLITRARPGLAYVQIQTIELFSTAAGTATNDVEIQAGIPTIHSYDNRYNRGQNFSLTNNGIEFYLDSTWTKGEYEVQVMRGLAIPNGQLDPTSYALTGASSLFDAVLSGSTWVAGLSVWYRSDMQIEAFQTHQAVAPFDPTGISYIALSIPNVQINSIYAEFTRYAPIYSGGVWTDTPSGEVPTSNPAALYRQLLLGGANANPVPGELIDEDELIAWYNDCVTNDYQCNAFLQGARVYDALQMLASAGYASPRGAATWGVVQDKDTSALPVSYAITPMNSQDLGTTIDTPVLPHAINATFYDSTDKYAQTTIPVFRDGYDISSATLYEVHNYTGFTTAAAVIKRATFDLKQSTARQAKYVRKMGLEGILLRRGDLVALNDDVLDDTHMAGWISSVQVSGGNVISVTLENVVPYSKSASIEDVVDFGSLADVANPSQPFGVGIRIPNQPMVFRQVSEVTDANTCTFSTPFVDDGSVQPGQLVLAGAMNNTHKRVKVISWLPIGFEEFQVELVDEAPQLFS